MLVKKPIDTGFPRRAKIVAIQGGATQLENLYARWSAVDSAIQVLEDYRRLQAKRFNPQTRQSA